MKNEYPVYKTNRQNPISEKVFVSLSNNNKKEILKFLNECSITSKSQTRTENRKRALTRFFDFIEKDWDKITYNDYVQTASAISNSKLGVYSRNDDRDFIKRFLREHFEDWRIRFKDLKLFKAEEKGEETKLTPRDLVTEKELERLLKATSNMKYKALISVLYESASRPEELLKLKWCDVDFDKKLIYLFSIKTKKKRAVPIEASINHLRRLKEEHDSRDDDLIFYSINKEKKITNSGLNVMLKELCKKARIKKNISPLLFRHTRLSFLITKLSPKVYEEISGHSLAMGMKTYAHLSQDRIITEMREKVFEIEELTKEEQEEIKELNKEVEMLKEDNSLFFATTKAFADLHLKKISDKEFHRQIALLNKYQRSKK